MSAAERLVPARPHAAAVRPMAQARTHAPAATSAPTSPAAPSSAAAPAAPPSTAAAAAPLGLRRRGARRQGETGHRQGADTVEPEHGDHRQAASYEFVASSSCVTCHSSSPDIPSPAQVWRSIRAPDVCLPPSSVAARPFASERDIADDRAAQTDRSSDGQQRPVAYDCGGVQLLASIF